MPSVLIVDDDLLYRGLMVEVLRLEGFQVEEAHSRVSALRVLESKPTFEVVLCDLQMDGMDGVDLLKTLRAEYPRVAVVVVSAHSAEHGAGATARAYATEYLNKPFSITKLVNTIRKVSECSSQGV